MMKTNHALIAASKNERSRERLGEQGIVDALKRWRWMNFVRAGLGLVGGIAGLVAFMG